MVVETYAAAVGKQQGQNKAHHCALPYTGFAHYGRHASRLEIVAEMLDDSAVPIVVGESYIVHSYSRHSAEANRLALLLGWQLSNLVKSFNGNETTDKRRELAAEVDDWALHLVDELKECCHHAKCDSTAV